MVNLVSGRAERPSVLHRTSISCLLFHLIKEVKRMKCVLKNHKGITPRYSETLLFCPLFNNKGVMSTVGVICVHHCLKTQQIIDALSNLVMRKEVTREDLKQDSEAFYPYISNELRALAEAISKKSGLTWEAILSECARCPATPVATNDVPKAEPTEITQVGKNSLKV